MIARRASRPSRPLGHSLHFGRLPLPAESQSSLHRLRTVCHGLADAGSSRPMARTQPSASRNSASCNTNVMSWFGASCARTFTQHPNETHLVSLANCMRAPPHSAAGSRRIILALISLSPQGILPLVQAKAVCLAQRDELISGVSSNCGVSMLQIAYPSCTALRLAAVAGSQAID